MFFKKQKEVNMEIVVKYHLRRKEEDEEVGRRERESGRKEGKKKEKETKAMEEKEKVLVEAEVENRQKEGAAESVSHGNRRLVGEKREKGRKEENGRKETRQRQTRERQQWISQGIPVDVVVVVQAGVKQKCKRALRVDANGSSLCSVVPVLWEEKNKTLWMGLTLYSNNYRVKLVLPA